MIISKVLFLVTLLPVACFADVSNYSSDTLREWRGGGRGFEGGGGDDRGRDVEGMGGGRSADNFGRSNEARSDVGRRPNEQGIYGRSNEGQFNGARRYNQDNVNVYRNPYQGEGNTYQVNPVYVTPQYDQYSQYSSYPQSAN